jgi:hypothetical protein
MARTGAARQRALAGGPGRLPGLVSSLVAEFVA